MTSIFSYFFLALSLAMLGAAPEKGEGEEFLCYFIGVFSPLLAILS